MIMKLTLNVGCGDRTYDEYPDGHKCINYDERANLKKVDEVGDVRDLSRFPDEHFDYILASDIIEHFPIAETEKILTEWKRVLKVGGVMIIEDCQAPQHWFDAIVERTKYGVERIDFREVNGQHDDFLIVLRNYGYYK